VHIAFLLTQSLESPSGLGRYWPLAKELVHAGHQVTILALHHDYAGLRRRRSAQNGVEVCYVGQMHVLKKGSGKQYFGPGRLLAVSGLSTWRLMLAALRVPVEAYHLGKPHPMNGLAVLLPHLMRGKPVFLDCDDYEAASNRFASPWQRRMVGFFEDHLPRIATGVTTNTRFTQERLMKLGYPSERIVYVPNGIDRDRFAGVEGSEVEALRRELGLGSRKVVLYVGSLSLASHAVDLLLEAFVGVQQVEPQSCLLLVGGGEDYERLQARAGELGLGDSVRFTGRVPAHLVPAYYGLAQLTVDPVHDDPAARARFPLKLVESLGLGIPVVTGQVGDRPALLSSGGGLLVRPGDAAALAEGILAILGDTSLHTRLSEQALQMRERYYWDRLAQDFARVYQVGS
jgi:glycosyltransferase involved in cell wall biosynthesis